MNYDSIHAIIRKKGDITVYDIRFYEKADGSSEVWDFMEELRIKANVSKDARIQLNQIRLYIQLLADNGTHLPEVITKHLVDDIWELRPGKNRVLYFYFEDDTFVLLHHFRKKTKKTPKAEIEKARREINDYVERMGAK